jgi:hypothetical protein
MGGLWVVYGWFMGCLWVVYGWFTVCLWVVISLISKYGCFPGKYMSESFGKSFHITNCKTSIRIDLV